MKQFSKLKGFADRPVRKKTPIYTKENILEAMRLYQKNHGHAPDGQSGLIKHGVLADNKLTWFNVSNAFIRGAVRGVNKKMRMHSFVKEHKLNAKTLYTKKNVLEGMRLYQKKYGHAPDGNSGVIRFGIIANGLRTWENVCTAFAKRNVGGVPENINMSEFAVMNGLKRKSIYTRENVFEAIKYFIIKHKNIPTGNFDLVERGELANGRREWVDVYQAFYHGIVRDIKPNVRMNDFAQSIFDELEASGQLNHIENFDADLQPNEPKEFPVNVCVHSPVTSKDVFNVVAAQLANSERLVSKKVFDPTNINSFERHKGRKITNGLTETNPIVLLGYTWERLVEDISLGYVVDLPQDFDLARYASKIEDRLQAKNYRPPPAGEVLRWMKLAA